MKAAILYAKEQIKIEDVVPCPLQPGEVRIDIQAALTCGTDLKVFKRGYHARMIVPPAAFGHELAGIVSEVRDANREMRNLDWHVGDPVVVANSAPCGSCFFCQKGRENLCDDLLFLNGAYAESIVIPSRLVEKNLLRLKPNTRFRDAALVEPLACVVQGVEDLRLQREERVLIIGSGPISLMFVALAKHLGSLVTVAGHGEKRLQTALRLGADRAIDLAGEEDLVSCIEMEASPPFDVVIEAVGRPETWETAVKVVRKGGRINLFGGCPAGATVTFDTTRIHYSALTLLASFHHTPRAIRRALELIESGIIRGDDFVDGECPLSQLPELFQSMKAGNRAVKTLIRPHD